MRPDSLLQGFVVFRRNKKHVAAGLACRFKDLAQPHRFHRLPADTQELGFARHFL
jgi:hypothetical protein